MLCLIMKDKEITNKLVLKAKNNGLILFWLLIEKKAVRITPPLTITKKDLKIGCEIILQILDKIWLVLISLLRSLNCLIEFKTNHIYF